MSVAFSTSDELAIQRTIDVTAKEHKSDVNSFYEIDKCVQWIQSHDFKRVALQFPDDLLPDAASVATQLEHSTNSLCFVLADTSYGSCCVDEVASQHYNAEGLIHYGQSCLSGTEGIPVMYVFGRESVDIDNCVEQLKHVLPDVNAKLILMYDVSYAYGISDSKGKLTSSFPNLIVSELDVPEQTTADDSKQTADDSKQIAADKCFCKHGRRFRLPDGHELDSYSFIFIGGETLTLTNLMFAYKNNSFYSYNPTLKTARRETLNVNGRIKRRYFKVEQAKDAQTVGILVGTLGVRKYMDVITHMKSLLKLSGKKSYMFVVGKLNVAKLANFMEIDVYVLVACPFNSLVDSEDYYRPIITPYELEIACNRDRVWTGDYLTDFKDILPGGSDYVEMTTHDPTTDVSLITGRVRNIGVDEESIMSSTEGAMVPRSDMGVVLHGGSASEFLSQRSWQGLEQKLGETPVTKAVEGAKGIAMSYTHEPDKP